MVKIGYISIDNLYKNTEILLFKECYALEKIHGTSAHINWRNGVLTFSPGGEKYEKFIKLFNVKKLEKKFKEKFECDVVIYGEAYGGKCQKMSETYGKELKFVVFDIKVDKNWLDVPNAEEVTKKLKLEFVGYVKIKTNLTLLNKERDKNSIQAIRNGCGKRKLREGIVLRPLIELTKNNENRIIAKHKRDEFKETKTKREVDPKKLERLEDAKAIAEEWVTPMRLNHVLDKLGNPIDIIETRNVIKAMIEDVFRESEGEIIKSQEVGSAISKKTAQLYKNKISKLTKEETNGN